MAANTILVAGQPLDLDQSTAILPTFQANDLTKPESIQADFSPQFSVPASERNESLLGQAAYASTATRLPYRKTSALLKANNVEIMPRAVLHLQGYESGRYNLQLFAGNRRFADALGEKTLRDLDLSRFDHVRTLDLVAQSLAPGYLTTYGWGYEIYDRGKGINLANINYLEVLPTISQRLIWQQILLDSGFTANEITEPLFRQGLVPATTLASFGDEFVKARNLLAGITPDTLIDNWALQDRADRDFPIPYRDRSEDGAPFTRPSAGNFRPGSVSGTNSISGKWVADKTCYIDIEARAMAEVRLADLAGKVSVKIDLYRNDERIQEGSKKITDRDIGNLLQPTTTYNRLEVKPGDVIYAVLRLKHENGINKYGYRIFTGASYQSSTNGVTSNIPGDMFKVTVLPEIPASAPVRLNDYLPEMKQIDYFKGMVQELGLTVQTDAYEDRLAISSSPRVLDTSRALDWTRKRDTPTTPKGTARNVTYKFGSYGQTNTLKWAEDETVTKGYGDGALLVDDETLAKESSLGELPFAATENSRAVPDFLLIPTYKRVGDALDPLNQEYSVQQPKPRLTLRGETTKEITLVETITKPNTPTVVNKRTLTVALSYFMQPAGVELNIDRYILPTCWRGMAAMLREARFHKERYRLDAVDIANLDFTRPIWDGVIGQFFAVSKVSEWDPERATEVELARLHPAFLREPIAGQLGREFFEGEFNISEFY